MFNVLAIEPVDQIGKLKYLVKHPSANVAIVVVAIGSPEFKEGSLLNKMNYAGLRGYDLIVVEENYYPDSKPAWSKLGAIMDVLDMNKYDWIFQIDLDTVIKNPSITVDGIVLQAREKFFSTPRSPDSEMSIIVSHDCNGLNTGQFLLKNNLPARHLIQSALKERHNTALPHFNIFYEQAALMVIVEKDAFVKDNLVVVDQKLLNSYPDGRCGHRYEEGDLLMHWAGGKRGIMDEVNNFLKSDP